MLYSIDPVFLLLKDVGKVKLHDNFCTFYGVGMRQQERDLVWLLQWCGDWTCGEPRRVSLDELVDHLGVARRTVQYWLKRLHSAGWIDWRPKAGRGHWPTLTLIRSPLDTLLGLADDRLNQGRIDEAFALVPAYARAEWFNRRLTQGAGPEQPHPEPKPDILLIPFYRGIHDLHPMTATRRTEAHLLNHIHARLLEFDTETGQVRPSLAHHWQEEGLSITFHLRKGVRFHDGSLLTAEDVERCLNALKRSDHLHAVHMASIKRIEVLGSHSLRLQLKRPNALLLHQLTLNCAAIYKPLAERKDPIGCGPFRLTLRDDDKTILTAFDQYFGYRPLIDQVHFWTIREEEVRLNENAHLVRSISQGAPGHGTSHVDIHREIGCFWLILNQRTSDKGFADITQRQAFYRLLDFSTCPGLEESFDLRAYGFEPGRRTPLNRMDTADSPPLEWSGTLRLVTYQLQPNIELGEWVCRCLQNNGIDAELTVVNFPDFNRTSLLRRFDAVISGEVFSDDILLSYFEFFSSAFLLQALLPRTRWQALTKATHDAVRNRKDLKARLEAIEDECLTSLEWIPLRHERHAVLTSRQLQGQSLNALGWIPFADVWMG